MESNILPNTFPVTIGLIQHRTNPLTLIWPNVAICSLEESQNKARVIEDLEEAKHVLFEELFENEIIGKRMSPSKNRTPLVIIVDELLDLIYMYKSKSSKHVSDRLRYEAIIKIINIGPELNIFTIIATQSSDKDILTKDILDNCRTRIAFRTITSQDSKRIIKKSGAENLHGNGNAILYQEGQCYRFQCK